MNPVAARDHVLHLMKMQILELRHGYAKVSMPLDDPTKNGMGFAHGGAIFSLADIAFGAAANEGSEIFVVTLNSSIEFLRPGAVGPLVAEARMIREGKRTKNYEVLVYDGNNVLIARTMTLGYETTTHESQLQGHFQKTPPHTTPIEQALTVNAFPGPTSSTFNPTAAPQSYRSSSHTFGEAKGASRPRDFNEEAFLAEAKATYVRMQSSWDQRNMDDIAQFTTPVVMDTVREQFRMDPNPSRTEIVRLNVQLVTLSQQGTLERAKVFFDVLLRETPDQVQPTPANEYWHFVRSLPAGSWKLDGIEQA